MSTLRRLVAGALLACGLAACGDETGPIRLATTTSTANSGLLEHLLPAFEAASGHQVHVIPVGTGQALELGRRGDADLLLVHARKREDAFVEAGHGIDRRDVMWNDFVIAGPPEDPAQVRGLESAAAALQRIARRGASFVSRGDDSGTHTRELELWTAGGGRPALDPAIYLEVGRGMGACLEVADQKLAYLLTDRGTFLAFRRRIDLVVLVEGDPDLVNPYGAIRVNPERHEGLQAEGARALLDYLTGPEGQRRIASFRVAGDVLFHPATGGE